MFCIFRKITIYALMLIIANSAIAAPVLKSTISVSSAIVTVGDMFENAGINAERALFRAPAPGTSGAVSLNSIRIAAKKVGITSFEDRNISSVQVVREGMALSEEQLKTIIVKELEKRGFLSNEIYAQLSFTKQINDLYAEISDNPIKLLDLRYMPTSSSFSAKFQIAGKSTPLKLSGHLNLMVNVPHLANSLQSGAIISPSDIEMRAIPLAYAQNSGFANIDQLIGKQIRRATRSGVMLRPSDIMEPEVISRSDFVTIYYKKGPLTLSIKGQALNSAAKGEMVSVLNLNSKNIVRGTAIAPGTVEINANSLTIANTQG